MTAQRLAQIRGTLGVAEFAKALGVHRNTYRSWESGRTEISAEGLRALAATGWNPLWVLNGTGPQRLEELTAAEPSHQASDQLLARLGDSKAAHRVEERFGTYRESMASRLRLVDQVAAELGVEPGQHVRGVLAILLSSGSISEQTMHEILVALLLEAIDRKQGP